MAGCENGNLYYLHTRQDIEKGIPVVDGVFMGGSFEQIRIVKSGELTSQEIRFFIGHSGWSPQLQMNEAGPCLSPMSLRRTSCAPTKRTRRFGSGSSKTCTRTLRMPKRPSLN